MRSCHLHLTTLGVLGITLSSAFPAIAGTCPGPEIKVLTYNVYMRPDELPGLWFANSKRAQLIAQQIGNADVIVFQEATDDQARGELLDRLHNRYPNHTHVVETDSWGKQDGGVIIVSRWPVEVEKQEIYNSCKGTDCLSEKGVIYARIIKKSHGRQQRFHIFGTHLNAFYGDNPKKLKEYQEIQKKQLGQLAIFIRRQQIPAGEPVIIAGDFNIDNRSALHASMLQQLRADELSPPDGTYTFDPTNDLVDNNEKPYVLDHVLFLDSMPLNRARSALDVEKPKAATSWKGWVLGKNHRDLSDHFPVHADYCFINTTKAAHR